MLNSKIMYRDIIELWQWMSSYLEKRNQKMNKWIDSFDVRHWYDSLRDMSREHIVSGFIHFTQLFTQVIENNMGIIPLNATTFKMLCKKRRKRKLSGKFYNMSKR